VLVASMFRTTRDVHPFPREDAYAEVAAEAGCAMRVVVERVGSGYDHCLFLVREYGMSDGEVLDCGRYDTHEEASESGW
jgi:hypothetical protein